MKALIKEIQDLREELSLMARIAQNIYEMALRSLETRNEDIGTEVLTLDRELDELELKLDRRCMHLLQLKAPYADDFRFVYSVIKTIKDLERVGDESKSIVKWSNRLVGMPNLEILNLGKKSNEALSHAIQCLIHHDPSIADQVLQLEQDVDKIEDRILDRNPGLAEGFIAKSMERVADMATNIAENVIFSTSARDIRHGRYNVNNTITDIQE